MQIDSIYYLKTAPLELIFTQSVAKDILKNIPSSLISTGKKFQKKISPAAPAKKKNIL